MLVDGDIIYLVSHDKDKDCSNFQLFSAKLNLQKIDFEKNMKLEILANVQWMLFQEKFKNIILKEMMVY